MVVYVHLLNTAHVALTHHYSPLYFVFLSSLLLFFALLVPYQPVPFTHSSLHKPSLPLLTSSHPHSSHLHSSSSYLFFDLPHPFAYLSSLCLPLIPLPTSSLCLPHPFAYLIPLPTSSLCLPHPFAYLIPLPTSSLCLPHPFAYLIPLPTSSLCLPHPFAYPSSLHSDLLLLTIVHFLPMLSISFCTYHFLSSSYCFCDTCTLCRS